MKTIILLISLTVFPVVLIADVLTLDQATVAKNEDGTVSLSFDLSKVPDRAHIDLAVLFVDGASLNLTEPVEFTLTNSTELAPDQKLIARGGFGKTRPDIAGKQRAQFLLTSAVQQWIGEETKLPELTLEGKSDAGRSALDATFTNEKIQILIYYTLPD
ncbi:MAG: hypothetical protein HYZ01_05535 [Ignavibacteriales bacterium]|nr:hypothetical protein [Ignavibacteriales bacterium]